jgi:hypothetical protein
LRKVDMSAREELVKALVAARAAYDATVCAWADMDFIDDARANWNDADAALIAYDKENS